MPIDEDPVWRTWNTIDGGQVIVKVVYRKKIRLWEVKLEIIDQEVDRMWKYSEFVSKSKDAPKAEVAYHAISLSGSSLARLSHHWIPVCRELIDRLS